MKTKRSKDDPAENDRKKAPEIFYGEPDEVFCNRISLEIRLEEDDIEDEAGPGTALVRSGHYSFITDDRRYGRNE